MTHLVYETTFKEPQYNQTFLLTDDKFHALGYIPHGETKLRMFNTPLKFNQKGRTFKEVK